MKIRSKKTNLEHEVTAKEWAQMQGRGDAKKYTIIDEKDKPSAPPVDTETANYNRIVKDATKMFKDEKWATAKKLYEKALAIKKTELVKTKLEEVDAKLVAIKEANDLNA